MTIVVSSLVMQGHLGSCSPANKPPTNTIKLGSWRGLEGALEPEHEALWGWQKSWGGDTIFSDLLSPPSWDQAAGYCSPGGPTPACWAPCTSSSSVGLCLRVLSPHNAPPQLHALPSWICPSSHLLPSSSKPPLTPCPFWAGATSIGSHSLLCRLPVTSRTQSNFLFISLPH